MARIAYVDHSYHSKTKSTHFLVDILLKHGHTVDFFWDESWKIDDEIIRHNVGIPFNQVADYDVVIMFQCRCKSDEIYFRKLHHNVIHIPMLDSFGNQSGPVNHLSWYLEFFQGCKILSFSSAMDAIVTGFGISSFYIKYYQQPIKCELPTEEPRAFFWIRDERHVSWPIIKKLIGDTKFKSIHLHIAPDPFTSEPTLPTNLEKKQYNITTSTWFNDKEEFLEIIENSNIFFAPRRVEGIGQSFLEAMARGQCVIAPNYGTMNEYILHGVNGLLYDPDNPHPLDFSNFIQLGKSALQSVGTGYKNWLEAENRLIEYILTPSENLYNGLYSHAPLFNEVETIYKYITYQNIILFNHINFLNQNIINIGQQLEEQRNTFNEFKWNLKHPFRFIKNKIKKIFCRSKK